MGPAPRNSTPPGRCYLALVPVVASQLKEDTSKHKSIQGGTPAGEGSGDRRDDEETVSAGAGGEMAEGGPHHRL